MPGIVAPSSVASVGSIVGMKRTLVEEAAPSYGEPHAKKRRVIHKLYHTQPTQHIHEPISAELDFTGQSKEFFDRQLQRAIAIECKGLGYDGAAPDAMERFRALVDGFMRNFCGQVRKSMTSARRTDTVTNDWIYALKSVGMSGSSVLEPHLDTGEIPTSLLQPPLAPPEPAEPPPPNVEGLLGAELSGRADKEARKYIPAHFPSFPPKHSWMFTPVVTKRENDPRKIREKATEEGILAEQSLRKLMAAQKAGIQGNKARKQRKSKRMKTSDALWQAAMTDLLEEEEARAEKERRQTQFDDGMDEDEFEHEASQRPPPKPERKVNLQEGVHVNYGQRFWRQSSRGV